jgi:hypothetical protein
MAEPAAATPNAETEALRAALAAATRREQVAVQGATQLQQQLRVETGKQWASQESQIDGAITQTDGEVNAYKSQWATLQKDGEFDKAADAMAKMSDASARLQSLRDRKAWVGEQRQIADRQAAAPPAPAQTTYTAAEQTWIARNPAYTADPAFQKKANAAAAYARDVRGLAQDTPEYFAEIEKAVYPDRAPPAGGDAAAQAAARAAAQVEGSDGGDSPFSGADPDAHAGDAPPVVTPMQQQHTLEAAPVGNTRDAPVMRIDAVPADQQQQQQTRAVGKGGDGMRAVAAPPSRRIVEASQRSASQTRNGRIEPTMMELETARSLYESIEPNATDRTDETIIRWYHALAHSPTHGSTRRRAWARDAVVG